MGEVRYSINGKYFKDYGVYVSSSLGLLDALKRKPIKTFNWPEYHGESLDLSSPKYEAREIVLNCFVTGDNYEEMFINFRNIVMSEFQKSGTQRLMVEAFGLKALPYEVYLIDDVKLLKEFKNSKTVGTFQLKLIEPNPIKKVLYLVGDTLNLSYNSTSETEIFYGDGTKQVAKGNVSLSGKVLDNRVVSGYGFGGRNLLLGTKSEWKTFTGGGYGMTIFGKTPVKIGEQYIGKVFVKDFTFPIALEIHELNSSMQRVRSVATDVIVEGYFILPITVLRSNTAYIQMNLAFKGTFLDSTHSYSYCKPKLERGNKSTDWTPAPEDEKFIIIAGNVDDITNLTTNAEVLWEKL